MDYENNYVFHVFSSKLYKINTWKNFWYWCSGKYDFEQVSLGDVFHFEDNETKIIDCRVAIIKGHFRNLAPFWQTQEHDPTKGIIAQGTVPWKEIISIISFSFARGIY